jgi:predicted ferric reductase
MRDPSLKGMMTIIAMPTLVMLLAVVLVATRVPIITAIAQNITRRLVSEKWERIVPLLVACFLEL